ncbi:PREDICTED: mesenchyme-specific cell surface glycoprotein-like [Branchiostoma belcheri]|uniref:Mesenchyme-specific cell surface glycoprotein-like n=1 Tax=Branchiostoma belcheri TaxID=7741 RepID=A0A6P4YEA0_BRABE|nr:PREDICTED: mesenchyme-specific cell surface glycoprotein-like [Branchiostoma belcheri]
MAANCDLQLHAVSLVCFFTLSSASLTLRPLSSVYLPYSLGGEGGEGPRYGLDTGAVEKLGYDEERRVVYAAGGAGILNVVDISVPSEPKVLHQQQLPGGVLDVDVCGDYVAIALEGTPLPPGRTDVYPVYQGNGETMVPLHGFKVGSTRPDSLKFTHDCRTLVVLDEGWPGEDHTGVFQDPRGAAIILEFNYTNLGSVHIVLRRADFRRFDEMASLYQSRGVRWLLGGSTATVAPDDHHVTTFNFSQTLEPEYVTFNQDDSKAYISLQDNNAIAVLDMRTATIEDLYPLGSKDWNLSSIDTSDQDGGINLRNWPIYGLRMPDAIKHFTHNGRGYIATANEGVTTSITVNGTVYSDTLRGQDIARVINLLLFSFISDGLLSDDVSSSLRDALMDPAQLGCVTFSITDGLDPGDPRKVRELHAFGGRGVSVFDAEDLRLVWDSGDDFERIGARVHPDVFNSLFKSESMIDETPEDSFDDASCSKGPEPQALTVGRMGDQTVIFVGNEKTSDIFLYSLRDAEAVVPRFESVYRGGRTDLVWAEAYRLREVGDITPEDLIFVPSDRSPNDRPLLLVGGTVSGTVSVYEVVDSGQTSTACRATATPVAFLWSFVLMFYTFSRRFGPRQIL